MPLHDLDSISLAFQLSHLVDRGAALFGVHRTRKEDVDVPFSLEGHSIVVDGNPVRQGVEIASCRIPSHVQPAPIPFSEVGLEVVACARYSPEVVHLQLVRIVAVKDDHRGLPPRKQAVDGGGGRPCLQHRGGEDPHDPLDPRVVVGPTEVDCRQDDQVVAAGTDTRHGGRQAAQAALTALAERGDVAPVGRWWTAQLGNPLNRSS